MINLTNQEREKFGIYCKEQAQQSETMIKVIEDSDMSDSLKAVVVKKEKINAIAFGYVASYLLSIEEDTISR